MELMERVHLVASGANGLETTHPGDCNVYLLETSEGGVLIDAGGGERIDLLFANVEQAGFDATSIRALLVTHTHYDHIAGAAEIAQPSSATIVASKTSAERLASGDEEATGLAACKRAGFYSADRRIIPVQTDLIVDEEQAIRFGDSVITPIHTPGHSSDHVSYLTVVSGKTVCFGGDFVFPNGRISLVSLPDCSLQSYLSSIVKFRGRRVDALLAGHFAPIMSGAAAHFDLALNEIDNLAVPKGV